MQRYNLTCQTGTLRHTSPRCDSPIGPLVSGLAMMIRTPGRICSHTTGQSQYVENSKKEKKVKERTHLAGLHEGQAVWWPPLHQSDPVEETGHFNELQQRTADIWIHVHTIHVSLSSCCPSLLPGNRQFLCLNRWSLTLTLTFPNLRLLHEVTWSHISPLKAKNWQHKLWRLPDVLPGVTERELWLRRGFCSLTAGASRRLLKTSPHYIQTFYDQPAATALSCKQLCNRSNAQRQWAGHMFRDITLTWSCTDCGRKRPETLQISADYSFLSCLIYGLFLKVVCSTFKIQNTLLSLTRWQKIFFDKRRKQ